MASKPVVVGTRGSKLALRQADEVMASFQTLHPDTSFDIRIISSTGDQNRSDPLPPSGVGIFVKELEEALLAGEIDMAVHSLKDLPTQLADGLRIGAIGVRKDPRDAVVSKTGAGLAALPPGARVGTGSPRRACLMRSVRPDIEVAPIRGNVPTRLAKLDGPDYDALILAAAGLERLGLMDRATELLDVVDFPPAPGQGALAIEVRSEDQRVVLLAAGLDHHFSHVAVTAERAFLRTFGGGCALAIGAYGKLEESTLHLSGFIGTEDGQKLYRGVVSGPASSAESVGEDLARLLLDQGAGELTPETPQ